MTLTDVLEHVPEPRADPAEGASTPRAGRLDCRQGAQRAGAAHQGADARAAAAVGYRPSLADNLVHVNHFSPASLRLALER